MRTGWKAAAAAAVASLGCVVPSAAQAACTPKSNIEAIVDDSGSMSYNDPSDLRVSALDLFIDTQGNEKRTLGAVEFGTDANPLFGPGPIGPNAAAYKAALKAALVEDGGGTDYNDAFALAGSHNPTATGRIFLTDGEHTDITPYADGHRGGPPVYVIGLGAGSAGGPSDELLKRIATETGGLYRRADDASQLQAAMFDLNSVIACQAPPKRFVDAFSRVGQTQSHSVKIPSRIDTAQFAVSWGNSADAFSIGAFRVVRHGKLVARGAKVRRLKVSRRNGATFTTVRVKGLRAGKLVFRVRAKRLSAPGTPVSLTTQVTRRALR
jgi:hypothetical protein